MTTATQKFKQRQWHNKWLSKIKADPVRWANWNRKRNRLSSKRYHASPERQAYHIQYMRGRRAMTKLWKAWDALQGIERSALCWQDFVFFFGIH